MKTIHYYLTIICLFFTFTGISQQQFVFSGEVYNQLNEKIEYGEIYLCEKNDISKVRAQAEILDGFFRFEEQDSSEYVFVIKAIGFATYQDSLDLYLDEMVSIRLRGLNVEMESVTILGAREAIQNNLGDIKMQVENSIFANQATSVDLLSQLPTILLSPNRQSLSIVGQGSPLIYLGNQRISFDQLAAIPVDNIASIEIIQNPSSKYEAEGRSLILVKRRKKSSNGYRGQLSQLASRNQGWNSYSGVNFSLKQNKFELQSNANYNCITTWEAFGANFLSRKELYELESFGKSVGPRNQFIGGFGLYYNINDNDYLSGNVSYTNQVSNSPLNNNSTIRDSVGTRNLYTFSDSKANRYFLSSNLNYNKKIGKGNVFIGGQYTDYLRGLNGEINVGPTSENLSLLEIRDQEFKINSKAIRVDYERPINEKHTIELGSQLSQVDATAFSDFLIIGDDQIIQNYDYFERTIAGYFNVSGNIKNSSYRLGLRVENNEVLGQFEKDSEPLIDRSNMNYFPSFQLNMPIDSSTSFRLFYNSSITRPNYLNASSITTFLNPNLEYQRNINLQSSIRHETGASLNWKHFNFSTALFRILNPVYSNAILNENTGRITLGPENYFREDGVRIDVYNKETYKKWTSTLFLRGTLSNVFEERAISIPPMPYLYFYTTQLIRWSEKINTGLTFWSLSDRNLGVVQIKGIYVLGMSGTYNLDEHWTISMNVNDLFAQQNDFRNYEINDLIIASRFLSNAQSVDLSIRYDFGGKWKSSYKNKDIDANLDRIN